MVTENLRKLGLLCAWIIEGLDRKLADKIGYNIEEKCDVTLSRAIQPLTFDVLRVLFFLVYFPISIFDFTIAHVLKWKDEEDLLSEKTVRLEKKEDARNGGKTHENEEIFWEAATWLSWTPYLFYWAACAAQA